jgi:hypothetical protein
MSAKPHAKGSRDYELLSRPLAPVEIDLSPGASPQPGRRGVAAGTTLLEAAEIDFSEATLAGPAVALRLTARLAPGAATSASESEWVGLLHALDDLDRAIGGHGLVLDPSLSGVTDGALTALLRPLDARFSLHRFTQMAEALGEPAVPRVAEPPPAYRNGERLAEVRPLSEGRGPAETESARDRVLNWRGRQGWLAGLQVELVQRKAT